MTRVADGVVIAENLSNAWIETTKMVQAQPGNRAFHTVTRIMEPVVEGAAIRAGCDALVAAYGMMSIDTVANTIFPHAMAEASASPKDLVERYLASYQQVRRFAPNNKGTYFGRIVAHASPNGPIDQLVPLVEKLRREASARTPMSARYEVRISGPNDVDDEVADGDDIAAAAQVRTAGAASVDVPIYSPDHDTNRRGFPCLSMLSFQLDGNRVHLFAQYRYEYLVAKGYGNYLGLAQLLEYVASEAGLVPGEMTIAAGRVQTDASERALARHLGQTWSDA
jgi:hypothetical protein